jgi:two-component system NtrC family sensor kinase
MGYLQQLAQDDSTPEPNLGPRWQPWVLTVTRTFRSLRESLRRERRSEAFKGAVVDHALAAIVIVDGAGRVVEWNPAAETMFRLPRERALGVEALTLIVPQRHRERFGVGAPWLQPEGAESILDRRVEMTGMRADGDEFPVEVIVSRIEIDGVRHFSSIVNDITQRRDAAQQIERQREALRQSEKLTAMGSLLAGVAHELNNPLAIVLGRAGLLEEKCEGLPELRADARRIREAAERCGRIVRTFLNMARSKPAQRSSLSLNDLARAAADMLGYIYRSHNIELRLELMTNLPPAFADGDQIGQVVLNLLVNAQQVISTHEGERRVTLSTGVDVAAAGASRPCVWLRVRDSGAGISPEVRGRLFEPFFTTKPEGLGTGLGLAVSRTLARDHGGDLVLEPAGASGEAGASFLLSLPLGNPAAQDGAVSTVPSALAEVEPRDAALVLVVDDEPEITELIRTLLESAGHEVASAESGAVALELIEAARFGAVVCDLHMPDMDGAALWREVSRRDARLARRFLFVTGDTLSPDARAFLKSTRCAALDKPFTRPDLLAGVAAVLA